MRDASRRSTPPRPRPPDLGVEASQGSDDHHEHQEAVMESSRLAQGGTWEVPSRQSARCTSMGTSRAHLGHRTDIGRVGASAGLVACVHQGRSLHSGHCS